MKRGVSIHFSFYPKFLQQEWAFMHILRIRKNPNCNNLEVDYCARISVMLPQILRQCTEFTSYLEHLPSAYCGYEQTAGGLEGMVHSCRAAALVEGATKDTKELCVCSTR